MNRNQLQKRLIDFAVLVTKITESMLKSLTGKHFADQLLRSGSAPALHYGESQSAESRKDFVHKMSIALKELRETYVTLRSFSKLNKLNAIKIKRLSQKLFKSVMN